jgi:hypothetical protein
MWNTDNKHAYNTQYPNKVPALLLRGSTGMGEQGEKRAFVIGRGGTSLHRHESPISMTIEWKVANSALRGTGHHTGRSWRGQPAVRPQAVWPRTTSFGVFFSRCGVIFAGLSYARPGTRAKLLALEILFREFGFVAIDRFGGHGGS